MALAPKIKKKNSFGFKKCQRCGGEFGEENFTQTTSYFHNGSLPICNSCVTDFLREADFDWKAIDKVCQWADIPWVPKEWERLKELNSEELIWGTYAAIFKGDEYTNLGWDDYYNQFKELKQAGVIEDELPLIREEKFEKLRKKWGPNYDDDELLYLEDLYLGLTVSQNINGALQVDQAKKICKLSLEIDSRIRSGDKEVDKFMSSYDKLVKSAEFTPKNAKNATDFDSMAELVFWLEKRGFVNKFYDGTTRDIIDETLKNIQNYNQRLYTNESGIGEEITRRLKALTNIQEQEDYYDTNKEYDLEEYEMAAFKDADEEEFREDYE